MKTDLDGAPLRHRMLTWSKSTAVWRRVRSSVEKAQVGTSVSGAANLPEATAKKTAAERCQWALSELAAARHEWTSLQGEQARGAALRTRLLAIKTQKQAEQKARAGKQRRQILSFATVLIAIVGIAGALWWQHRPPPISKAAVEQSLARELGKRGLSISSLSFRAGQAHGGSAEIFATFSAKLDRPLFLSVPTAPHLQSELKLDPGVSRRISELTSGVGARRILELAALPPGSSEASRATLIKLATPAGNLLNGMANFTATKRSGGWEADLRSFSLPGLSADQKPRDAFTGEVFELTRDEDRARLRALVEGQPSLLAKLEQAREAYASEVMAQHRAQEVALLPIYRAGTVFTTFLPARNPSDKKPVFLELTEAAGGAGAHAVKALIHNDGGWADSRPFEGEWKFEAARERFEMSLVSRSDQAIRGAGPVLEDARVFKLDFTIDADRLSGELGGATCQWTRVPDAEVAQVRRASNPDYYAMLEAMTTNALFLASLKMSETVTEQFVLRFVRVERDGAVVEATVQDPTREASQFRLAGTLIGNRYREARWPLRLTQIRDSVPPGIPPKTFALQFPVLALHMENGTFIGDYRGRPFAFERLGPEETARRLQATAAWRQALELALRPGTSLDGLVVNPQESSRNPVRLRVTAVDATKGTIDARLESAANPALFRNVNGKIFPEAGCLNLGFDVRPGTYGVARTALEPFFQGGRDNLVLQVEGMALTGRDGHTWSFEFRLGPGAAARGRN